MKTPGAWKIKDRNQPLIERFRTKLAQAGEIGKYSPQAGRKILGNAGAGILLLCSNLY
ncbi:MAG: hypothetical protein P4N60_21065 [Verrucomicrobiae bacterium]|nr:hypothetical protein [Verrucomicrobiae bacterium]